MDDDGVGVAISLRTSSWRTFLLCFYWLLAVRWSVACMYLWCLPTVGFNYLRSCCVWWK
jgi:hypothetical protein